jgi:fatty acid desaturase
MKPRDILSTEEIQELMRRSDWRGALEIAHTWGWIAAAFALSGLYPHPVTIIISLLILGGKQLACAIIMHDAAHYSLFEKRETNEWVGNWFGAYPIFHNVFQYRPYHLRHHAHTGTTKDPDLNLTRGYPTTRPSMLRKFFRDLSGQTGLKGNFGLLMMNLGAWEYQLSGLVTKLNRAGQSFAQKAATAWRNLRGPLAANLLMLGIFWAVGAPWLYLLWVGALLTTYQFSLRVRSIAEHSVVPNPLDNQQNTRTTYANFVERILFAPHNVNYHAEHHFMMAVPCYNLPKLHKLMLERGYYERGVIAPGYWHVIRQAMQKPRNPGLAQA